MYGKCALAAILAFSVAVPAAAAETPDSGAKPVKSKRICRVQGETGTRFKRRVCATTQEWAQMDEIAAEARKDIDKVQQQRSIVDQ